MRKLRAATSIPSHQNLVARFANSSYFCFYANYRVTSIRDDNHLNIEIVKLGEDIFFLIPRKG